MSRANVLSITEKERERKIKLFLVHCRYQIALTRACTVDPAMARAMRLPRRGRSGRLRQCFGSEITAGTLSPVLASDRKF
ncbi:hypothetical protein SLEP1_g40238 [Rubroshorea leprosula]|uniref:Uncharacterized protein n=1 Tax=Rubroshorea leprosula TaxID=152421 RepID=A0AAV5L329_9ROSI|nr:hypothetical protein SLEP1_g40238 [Rubroshorea leprosula]